LGQVLRAPAETTAATRWRGQDLNAFDAGRARALRQRLERADDVRDLVAGDGTSAWRDAKSTDGLAMQAAADAAVALNMSKLPTLRATIERLTQGAKLKPPKTLKEAEDILGLLRDAENILAKYSSEIFRRDPASLARALEPARSGVKRVLASLTSAKYRDARDEARGSRKDKAISDDALRMEIEQAAHLLEQWQHRAVDAGQGIPTVVAGHDQTSRHLDSTNKDIAELTPVFPGEDFCGINLDELDARVAALAADREGAFAVPEARKLEQEVEQAGAGQLLEELRATKARPSTWPDRFWHAWLGSWWDRVRAEDGELAAFDGRGHDKVVDSFDQLDTARTQHNVRRILHAHAGRAVAARNAHPDQDAIVKRESEKRSRHLPLRKLIASAPDVLTSLFPCWMASPLSVSQLLDGSRTYFDVVLFDEASQIPPEDAISAILRGEHALVAGDPNQLPPTRFFADGGAERDDPEHEDQTAGYDSLLDIMQSFLDPWLLEWHYRSKDESLISFSNQNIYGNRLVTFPGADVAGAITHKLVETQGSDASTDSSGAEVQMVVEMVLAHARSRPNESLGVITMGIKHAQRIQAAIDEAILFYPELDAFINAPGAETFFVKNLERVQGDERDAIILSIGYGKDASGKLPYRFGPLLTEGGERRLNVAITRARYRLMLVSSFDDRDMESSRSARRGVELLRQYLAYARGKGRATDLKSSAAQLGPFEADVYDALSAKGLKLVPQWGSGRFRIDFAVHHPALPDKFVMAIECDGANYKAAESARDRDRLRARMLKELGWQYYRIWSVDWYARREAEIARLVKAYETALATPKAEAPAAPTVELQASGPAPAVLIRPHRPDVRPGLRITEYVERDLIALANWIATDGQRRTVKEMADALFDELGFGRWGTRIREVLERVGSAVS
jgi:very-short-patch-repair endonuclease